MYSFSDFMCKLRELESTLFMKFHALPFVWDSQTKLFKVHKNLKRRYNQTCCIIPVVLLFLTIQLIYSIYTKQLDQKYFVIIHWIMYSIYVALMSTFIWKLEEYLALVNGMILFGNKIASKFTILTKNTKNMHIF